MSGETITSAAELDALPVGSVVADSVARLLRTSTSSVHPTEPGPWVDEFGQFFESSRVIPDGEPLTVLYRPDRPFEATVSDEDRGALALALWDEDIVRPESVARQAVDRILDDPLLASHAQAALSVSREQRQRLVLAMYRALLDEPLHWSRRRSVAERCADPALAALGIEVRDER